MLVTLFLTGCVSSQNARFYHPNLGVVDGNNQQLIIDSQDCFARNSAHQLDKADVALATAGTVTRAMEENSVSNVALSALLLKKGYQLASNQSSCLTKKGWQRLDNAD